MEAQKTAKFIITYFILLSHIIFYKKKNLPPNKEVGFNLS